MLFRFKPVLVALCLLGLWDGPIHATLVGGGGGARTDCLLAIDAPVNVPPRRPRHVSCVDGDATCDSDATVNGVCAIPVAACANSTFEARCTLTGINSVTVAHALDNGDPRFDPDFQGLQARIDNELGPPTALQDRCTLAAVIRVPIRGPFGARCSRGHKKLRITTVSSVIGGRVFTDRDRMKLSCLPAPVGGCDPTVLFQGTFDRIQKQIFNQSCALGGCHDSQSGAGGLLLESGSSYTNLVGVVPANGSASAAGWQRVDAARADPQNSFLWHKITGDTNAGQGERMPFGRRRLHRTMRDLIRLWIEAGAPAAGWVAGTGNN